MIKVSASNLLLAWGRGVRIGKEKQLEVASNGKRYRWGWRKNTIVSRRLKIDLHPASFFIKLLRSRHSNFWDVTKVQALVFVFVITEFQAELDFYWLIIIDLTGSRWRWNKNIFCWFWIFCRLTQSLYLLMRALLNEVNLFVLFWFQLWMPPLLTYWLDLQV